MKKRAKVLNVLVALTIALVSLIGSSLAHPSPRVIQAQAETPAPPIPPVSTLWIYEVHYEDPVNAYTEDATYTLHLEEHNVTPDGVVEPCYRVHITVPGHMEPDGTPVGYPLRYSEGTSFYNLGGDRWHSMNTMNEFYMSAPIWLPSLTFTAKVWWTYTAAPGWPFYIGKTWAYHEHRELWIGDTYLGIYWDADLNVCVVAEQDITVPAGIFHCFKIEHRDAATDELLIEEYWSSSVLGLVKKADYWYYDGVETWELSWYEGLPIADAEPDSQTVDIGMPATFSAEASVDPDGYIADYEWDFGDGTLGTGVTASHAYTAEGYYTVRLTVTDNDGGTDSDDVTVIVLGDPPVADANGPYSGLQFLPVSFDGGGSSDDSAVTEYEWDFGDGTTGSGVTPSHTYANFGTFTVTLTVYDSVGQSATDSTTVDIGALPTADPEPDSQTVDVGMPATFSAEASVDPDGYIVGYEWNFGDGTLGTGSTTSHAYTAEGDYTVRLTVTDNDGGTDSDDVIVTVLGDPPVADANGPYSGLQFSPVTFDGSGSADDSAITAYEWDFGDGTTGAGVTPSHTYTSFGMFTVTLTVYDSVGQSATDSISVDIAYVPGRPPSHNVAVIDDYYGSAVGYLYPSDYPDQTFSPLAASQVSAEMLANYDTVILYMFNPSLLNATQKAAINNWVYNGGKLIIWDSDQVPPGSPWDYTWLPYPFTTSVPGQQGATGKGLEIIEENQLSSSDPGSPYYIDTDVLNSQTDAVGDANVLTSYSPGWHIDMMATNVLGETGPAHVYAAYGSGLIIYSALDWDYAGYNRPTGAGLKKMLRQELDCTHLPFGAPEVPEEVGLIVEVTSDKGSYGIGETIGFDVTVTNPTDVTGINVIAYNVLFTPVPPDEIELETPEACYILGDISPGESRSGTFNATAKTAGDNIEIIVNAYGEDRLLGTVIAGSGKYTFSIFEPEADRPDWSFAIVTDLHIGYNHEPWDADSDSYKVEIDYGAAGYDDSEPLPEEYNYCVTDRLASAIERIMAEKEHYNIKFAVVLGDISDTAEKSEFFKARELLNRLNDPNGDGNTDDGIPYIPLMGNHDNWPYTQDIGTHHFWDGSDWRGSADDRDYYGSIASYAKGDEFLKDVFWGESNSSNKDLIEGLFEDSWKHTYDKTETIKGTWPFEWCEYEFRPLEEKGNEFYSRVQKEDISREQHFFLQNYGFSYGGITLVCLDFNPRLGEDRDPRDGDALPGTPVTGCFATDHEGTLNFSKDYYKEHRSDTVVLFSHHPIGAGAIHDKCIESEGVPLPRNAYNFVGHLHRNARDHEEEDDYHIYRICTEDLAGIPLSRLTPQYMDWLAGWDEVEDRSGKVIRIVQVKGEEIDFSTKLKLSREIAILYPSPFFDYGPFASYPQPNEDITFTAHYTTYHGFKTSFEWDFGDGNFSSGSSVTHSYSQEGDYDVTLTVTTKNLVTGEETTQSVTGTVCVRSKHIISSLRANLYATSLLTEEDLTQVPKNTYQPALIAKEASDETPIVGIGVHFEEADEDLDLSSMVADVDLAEAKSVIYMPSWPAEVEEYKLLFIPSTGAGAVYICSNATSLDEVSPENADLVINVGETENGITVTTTFYDGREYYLVSGVTGTGGGEMTDTTPPEVQIEVPQPDEALQDGVTLTAAASDVSGVAEVRFYVREPDGAQGTPIGYEDLSATLNAGSGNWEYPFDTTKLLDGYYVILAKAIDTYGNEGWSDVVPFSIRNWAVIELLPASKSNKAGRTMPVKFSLRIAESVDPAQPFVHNEELEIRIYDAADPGSILQTSLYGDTSVDYRIDSVGELYITNFKTAKQPAQYVVEIWRTSKNFLVGSFTFETVK